MSKLGMRDSQQLVQHVLLALRQRDIHRASVQARTLDPKRMAFLLVQLCFLLVEDAATYRLATVRTYCEHAKQAIATGNPTGKTS